VEKAGHDKMFKPAKRVKERIYTMSYDYKENPPLPKRDFRNPEDNGAVTLGPRNFLTNPMKEGKVGRATSFGGLIPYKEDDYDRQRKIAAKERADHMGVIAETHDAKNFSQKAKRSEFFNSYK